ncbi:MAG: ArsC family reductase [Mariprofundaceae bacterium]
MRIYGIANCDTVRKARRWCREQGVHCTFHDFRKDGLDEALLRRWADAVGVKALLNRRGMTWRKLDEASRNRADDEAGALALMLEYPTLIRRPVVEIGERVFVGFDPDAWREAL